MTEATEADQYFMKQINSELRTQGDVLTWAYMKPKHGRGFADVATSRAAFVAITTQRLILIETRIGVFKPLLENLGIIFIERDNILGACKNGASLCIDLSNGRSLSYFISDSNKYISRQRDFFAKIESILGRSERGTLANRAEIKKTMILGLVIAVIYVFFRLLV